MSYIYKSGKEYGLTNITINQNTPTRELTQAQYDALPASEKRNGTIYFIIDATSDKIIVSDPAPIGAILAYAGDTAPNGWLICAGQAISRTTYADLFAIIGTTYGNGDGSTTFNIPDLRGNVAVGASVTYDLGDTGGEAEHTLTIDEMPSHKHEVSYRLNVVAQGTAGMWYFDAGTVGTMTTDTPSVANTGGSQAHNNMQPYIVTNYIIKAKETSAVIGTRSGGGSVDSTPIPTATLVAEFDDNAHMNSEDMSSTEVNNFINSLNIIPKIEVEQFNYSQFTYSTNIQPYSTGNDTNTPQAYKYGRIVMLTGAFQNSAQLSAGQVIIGKVPSGCEPICAEQRIISQGSSLSKFLLLIQRNGDIVIERYGTTTESTVPVNAWINISCSYISAS